MKRISIAFLSLFLCVASVWSMPRPEYPRPQFERAGWVNLNGEWTCSFDFGGSGMEREFYKSKGFDKKITVPFCPESKLVRYRIYGLYQSFLVSASDHDPAGMERKEHSA